ncbi:MAG: hypothetical protein ACRD1K_10990 [Acidimicrobiales bacterium]
MNRDLRARVLLDEARALGIDVHDLVAAATGKPMPITVAAWIDEVAPTFGPSTAATYRPYWRLAAAHELAFSDDAESAAGLGEMRRSGSEAPALEIVRTLVGSIGLVAAVPLAGARDIGAARGQLVFASAPFVGVAVAWVALGDPIRTAEVLALALAAFGMSRVLGSHHLHDHHHDAIEHDHEHAHDDDHHDHPHDDDQPARHAHRHRHEPSRHAHPHVPDLHHRHVHAE